MLSLDAIERSRIIETLRRDDGMEHARTIRPIDWYTPHERGQVQFHKSTSIVRALWPGNGFGKTRAMGSEVGWWCTHSHPYQPTPRWPVIVIWAAETYKQFDILREQLQTECFGPERSDDCPWGWRFNESKKVYEWAAGDKLFLISGDASWTSVQGINPDLCCFDEEPPRALWNEMKMRRRGRRKTRYCFAATATQGLTWMHAELYLDWLGRHNDAGLSEDQAHQQQLHPRIWAWAKGGIDDNPGADAGDRDWYHSQTWSSDAERQVRLGGGFADFSGKPVFDQAALLRMKPELLDGEDGWLVPRENVDPDLQGVLFDWQPNAHDPAKGGPRGRMTIFEHPQLDKTRYVIGHDSAYGLEAGDFDYAVVLDRNTGKQVAEAQGHWGDAGWAEVLHALGWYYGIPRQQLTAFLCGERQVGLMVMRRLMDEMGLGFQFYDRDEAQRARRRSDTLGHHRRTGDLTIPRLRRAIGPRDVHGRLLDSEIIIRSRELWRQMTKYQFKSRKASVRIEDAHDSEVATGAPTGDHDDGVMALGYALMGCREVPNFEEPEATYSEGSYGQVFKMAERLHGSTSNPPQAVDPFARDDDDDADPNPQPNTDDDPWAS